MTDSNKILSLLLSLPYVSKDILNNALLVKKDLSYFKPTKHLVYPCNVIDLRDILSEDEIQDMDNILLFSVGFAEKYLKRFPIFIFINTDNLNKKEYNTKDSQGAVQLIPLDRLNIKNSIERIQINEPVDNNVIKAVEKIIYDTKQQIEVINSNSIPGISGINPKLSFNICEKRIKNIMNWYNKISQTLPLSLNKEPILQEDEQKVTKGPKKAIFPFQVGMKVRDRREGIALPQNFGIIKDITNDKLTVEWQKGKKKYKTDYNLDDTISLSATIAEV